MYKSSALYKSYSQQYSGVIFMLKYNIIWSDKILQSYACLTGRGWGRGCYKILHISDGEKIIKSLMFTDIYTTPPQINNDFPLSQLLYAARFMDLQVFSFTRIGNPWHKLLQAVQLDVSYHIVSIGFPCDAWHLGPQTCKTLDCAGMFDQPR